MDAASGEKNEKEKQERTHQRREYIGRQKFERGMQAEETARRFRFGYRILTSAFSSTRDEPRPRA
jgi:hypothetical protein